MKYVKPTCTTKHIELQLSVLGDMMEEQLRVSHDFTKAIRVRKRKKGENRGRFYAGVGEGGRP